MQTSAQTENKVDSSAEPCAPEWLALGSHVRAPSAHRNEVLIASCELGRGIFATRNFHPGETVLWFTGKLIDLAAVKTRGDKGGNTLQVDWDRYIDVEPPGLFVNHSCDPNAGLRDSHRLVTLRPIAQGEEIRMDYSTEMWRDIWNMECRCGSAHCRSMIVDFDLLPPPVQAERLRLGIVQPYIVRRLAGKRS